MVVFSTMTSSDVGALVGAVQWAEEGSYVKEVISKNKFPQLAKVIKGQYLNVGVPSLSNPSLASTLLLLSGGKPLRIAAQCVKFKEGRRVVAVGPKLAIPETYDGYFEILSEDGRAVRCMESVSELSKRFPDSCLVRENIKAFVSRSDNVETITEKSRFVQVGETLVLVGEVIGGTKNGKIQQRFLRCFDQSGQNLYLPLESKGKFSAIAKEDNISGVHSVRNLLNKRLPLMVRLIHGQPPLGSKLSQFLPELRLFAAFSEEPIAALPLGKDSPLVLLPPSAPLKLTHAKNSENLEKSKEFLKLCDRVSELLLELSEKMYAYDVNIGSKTASSSKDPRFYHLPDQNKHRSKNNYSHIHRQHRIKSPPDKIINKEKNGKLDDYDEIDQIYDYVRGFAPLPKNIKSIMHETEPITRKISAPAKLMEKIDTRPIPPPIETIPGRKCDIRSVSHEKLIPSLHPALISAVVEKAERKGDKIDKKMDKISERQNPRTTKFEKMERKVEKRLRNSDSKRPNIIQPSVNLTNIQNTQKITPESKGNSNKLFIKASQQKSSKSKLFRHKSSSPVKETVMDVVSNSPTGGLAPSLSLSHVSGQNGINGSATTPSPLFKLRYKSLTNLAMDFDTLDSSTSGGKNSTDSCGSVAYRSKIPEKRSRKLPRPMSLTNLVWDGRGPIQANEKNGFNGISSPRTLLEAERKMRLEPGVYRHTRDAPALLAATTRMLASQKKIGTLYL